MGTDKLSGSDLRWTSIPFRGSRNTPSRFMLQKPGIRSSAMGQSALQLHFFKKIERAFVVAIHPSLHSQLIYLPIACYLSAYYHIYKPFSGYLCQNESVRNHSYKNNVILRYLPFHTDQTTFIRNVLYDDLVLNRNTKKGKVPY